MASFAGAAGANNSALLSSSSASLPEDRDALVHAVTHGLADLKPGPELAKECAARRGEIWTILGQLKEVVRFTEQAMTDEDRLGVSQHSHRLRLATDLLQGLLRGAAALEQLDRDRQPADGRQALEQEYSSIRTSVRSLNVHLDQVSNGLKERGIKLAPDGREDIRSRLISPLLGVATSAVTLLGGSAIGRIASGASRTIEAGVHLGDMGSGGSKSSSGAPMSAAVAPPVSKSTPREDPSSPFSCMRCHRGGARIFCEVVVRSIFDVDPLCRHGPFCHRCHASLVKTVLATCACRALISSWRVEEDPT